MRLRAVPVGRGSEGGLSVPVASFKGRAIVYYHVPKTGGTSVEEYLARRFGPLGLLDREWVQRQRRCGRSLGLRVSPQHLTAEDLALVGPREPLWRFVLVRDPMARMISEYRFQRKLRGRIARLGFSRWLRVMLAARARDPTVYDNHFRLQVDFIAEGTEVFRLEDGLEPVARRLDAVTGTTAPEIEFTHELNTGRAHFVPHPADCERVARVFEQDYRQLGYQPAVSAPASDWTPRALTGRVLGWSLARHTVRQWHRGQAFRAL